MSAATKVSIAVVVLFAVVLGVYYGFGGPDVPQEALPARDDSVEPQAKTGHRDDGLITPQPVIKASPSLSDAVQEALGTNKPSFAAPAVRETTVSAPDGTWILRAPPVLPGPEPRVTPAGYVEYTVKENESLWTIADEWLGSGAKWNLIAEANPSIDPNRLRVGQVLRLPEQEASATDLRLNRPATVALPPAPKPAAKAAVARGGTLYTVRSGDTLSKIAISYFRDSAKWRAIYDANRAAIGWDPDRLRVGMRLRIPS